MKRAILAIAVAFTAGCTLLPRSSPTEIHYFTVEAPVASARAAEPAGAKLRLGRVTSNAHLRSRIAFRESTYEVGSYADRRWTEAPEAYLRRALARALFEERGLAQVVSGGAPILDVELVTFEELRAGATRGGRVELAYVLHDEGRVLASGRVHSERPAAATDMQSIVAAIALALADVTARTSDAVATRLAR